MQRRGHQESRGPKSSMDSLDSMGSLTSEEETVPLIQQLKELLMKAEMYPRKWLSKLKKILIEVDMENRTKQINLTKYG